MATTPVGPYSNPMYNQAAIQQYATLWGVNPSQIQYVNGKYQLAQPSPAYQPTYQQGVTATGGGIKPAPLNPNFYATPGTAQQVAGLLGGQVVPDTSLGGGPGIDGSMISAPTPLGIRLPNGQIYDAGQLAGQLQYSQTAPYGIQQATGGAVNLTPQQLSQFYAQYGGGAGGGGGATPGSTPSGAAPTSLGGGGGAVNPATGGDYTGSSYASPAAGGGGGTYGGSSYGNSPYVPQTPLGSRLQQPGGGGGGSNYQPPEGTYGGPGNAGLSGVYNYSGATPFEAGGLAIPGGAMPAGQNPQFPNWNTNPYATNPSIGTNPVGNVSSTIGGVYQRALDYGNQFNNQFGAQYQQAIDRQNTYQTQGDAAYSDLYNTPGYTTDEYGRIINQPGLSAVQGVPGATGTALGQNLANTRAGFNRILDPNQLTFSNQYVQQLKDQAGRQIGAEYGAAEDQLQRQADAYGQVNPLALSAARNRLLQSQAINQADAVTQADIAATGAQLQSRQALAGQQAGAQTALGQMGQGAAEFTGQLGLGASQYADTALSNRVQQAANARIAGQQAARNYWQGQGQYFGSQAQSGAQDVLSGAQTSLGGMGQASGQAANTSLGRQGRLTFGPISMGL